MVAMCGCKGHSKFLQKRGEAKQGKIIAARGSDRFAGQRPVMGMGAGLCGKEASLLQAFLVTFLAKKVTGPRAAKSATMLVESNKSCYLPADDCFPEKIRERLFLAMTVG